MRGKFSVDSCPLGQTCSSAYTTARHKQGKTHTLHSSTRFHAGNGPTEKGVSPGKVFLERHPTKKHSCDTAWEERMKLLPYSMSNT